MIELVIVVVIIGVLGAIAIPRLSRGSEGARVNAFVAELNTFAKGIDRYRVENGTDIADSSTGDMPAELSDYLHENAWEGETPIGGFWDVESNGIGGYGLAVGVHFIGGSVDKDAVEQVDRLIDDGDMNTGAFRQLSSDRFYLILEN
ncbi:MAG: hypothetical protein KTR15_14070 [Phycisphaeraceae bacterium]|nr:hypothetical protein [Phycisphaeraceae bacterium]